VILKSFLLVRTEANASTRICALIPKDRAKKKYRGVTVVHIALSYPGSTTSPPPTANHTPTTCSNHQLNNTGKPFQVFLPLTTHPNPKGTRD
jgi:hypothetical protein